MTCEEFEELSGAYAIGALPPAEMADARAHLASCNKHADVRELQLVTAGLGAAAEMEPPPALKTRLMDATNADLRSRPPARTTGEGRTGIMSALSGLFRRPAFGYALSGALAVAVAGLLIWNISLQSDGGTSSGGDNRIVAQLTGAASGEITYLKDQQITVVTIDGLEPAPDGMSYQAWVIRDGQPTSLGIMRPDDTGEARALLTDREFRESDTIAITVEPAGGSQQPTSDPIISGTL